MFPLVSFFIFTTLLVPNLFLIFFFLFAPPFPSSTTANRYVIFPSIHIVDTIYENLSYCASLHQDENDDDFMDEDDIYQDDEDDHEGLYADADIQGGYIPRSSSATAIGHQADNDSTAEVPAIDLQSGEWFTGNAETDAAFELSEQGQVTIERIGREMAKKEEMEASGKRMRDGGDEDGEGGDEDMGEAREEATEEEQQEARSKMWRAY